MEQIPVSDVVKWFKMNQRPEWDILQGKNAIFGFDGLDDINQSLEQLEESLQELPAGNYQIRAKKHKAPNSAYKQISFNVPPQQVKQVNKMDTEASFKARLESEMEKERLKLHLEYFKKDFEKLEQRCEKIEQRFEELINIVEDLFDSDSGNDNKAKSDLSSLLKKGSEIAESSQTIVKSFLKK